MAFSGEVGSFPRVRSLGKIFLYALATLLGGSLAASPAWHFIQHLPSGWLHGLIGDVQRMPFHRYLSRSIQVAAVVFLWPLLRSLRICSLEELGLYRSHRALRDFGAGLASGIPSALLLVIVLLLSGAFEVHASWSFAVIPRILLTALVVAVLEEFFFRGVLLGFLRQFLGAGTAVVLSALFFAVLHFLNLPSSEGTTGNAPHWWSGIAALATVGKSLPPWPILEWAFGTLFVAGILLGWMTIRTGSLWASIALHGSWIFAQQLFTSFAGFRRIPPDTYLPYVGPAQCHGAVPIGIVPLFALLLVGVLAVIFLKKRPYPRTFTPSSR